MAMAHVERVPGLQRHGWDLCGPVGRVARVAAAAAVRDGVGAVLRERVEYERGQPELGPRGAEDEAARRLLGRGHQYHDPGAHLRGATIHDRRRRARQGGAQTARRPRRQVPHLNGAVRAARVDLPRLRPGRSRRDWLGRRIGPVEVRAHGQPLRHGPRLRPAQPDRADEARGARGGVPFRRLPDVPPEPGQGQPLPSQSVAWLDDGALLGRVAAQPDPISDGPAERRRAVSLLPAHPASRLASGHIPRGRRDRHDGLLSARLLSLPSARRRRARVELLRSRRGRRRPDRAVAVLPPTSVSGGLLKALRAAPQILPYLPPARSVREIFSSDGTSGHALPQLEIHPGDRWVPGVRP
mmetsp:Transcript_16851/g.28674  ORF Transcript_16851/g.28674 Transcript_16851/m.28674 type:complete len:355 (+) Transcript_16851:280-1344(+)